MGGVAGGINGESDDDGAIDISSPHDAGARRTSKGANRKMKKKPSGGAQNMNRKVFNNFMSDK